MGKRKRLVQVVVRGCIFSLPPKEAVELEKEERKLLAREWNTNEHHQFSQPKGFQRTTP